MRTAQNGAASNSETLPNTPAAAISKEMPAHPVLSSGRREPELLKIIEKSTILPLMSTGPDCIAFHTAPKSTEACQASTSGTGSASGMAYDTLHKVAKLHVVKPVCRTLIASVFR